MKEIKAVKAAKTFRGTEGLVRRGDIFTVTSAPEKPTDMTPERAKALLFTRNVEIYEDRMRAAPVNQMRRDPDPKGMTAVNAGGLVTFGDPADALGNVDRTSVVQNGFLTGEADSQSSSPADPAPPVPILTDSNGRRLRGRRPS